MCMGVLPTCMSGACRGQKEGIQVSGAGVTGCFELTRGCWDVSVRVGVCACVLGWVGGSHSMCVVR